ncbi:MAG: glycerophosphodiester phosphodiesterase [Halioglobus sp.]
MDLAAISKKLGASWRQILVVHALFSALGFFVLMPLFGVMLQMMVGLSGASAVADQDIARLLLSPLGMVGLIVLLGLFLAILALEVAALLLIVESHQTGQQANAVQAVGFSVRNAPKIFGLAWRVVLRVLVVLLPYLLVVAVIAWVMLREYDINYYLAQKPRELYLALAIAALPTVVFLWLLGRRLLVWALVLPLTLFDSCAPASAFTMSEQLVVGDRKSVVLGLLTWVVLSLGLAAVPALFLDLGWGWAVERTGAELSTVLVLLASIMALWFVLNFIVSALSLAGLVAVITELQLRFLPEVYDRWAGKNSGALGRRLAAVSPLLMFTAIAITGTALLLVAWNRVQAIEFEDDVLVIAHRGAAGKAPENTLASVRQAVIDGADWVEIDVQETRDGKIVVIHDSDFMKLANRPMKVWEGDLAQIQQIDIGSWFSPTFAGERVPTLEQVLAETRDRATLLIELKYYGHDQALEQRVIDIVESMGMSDQVKTMSLKLQGVQKLKQLRPDWTGGLLAATAIGDLSRLDADFLAVKSSMASHGFIRRAQEQNKQVFVWTVNDALSLSKWMSMGVDGVITDEPELARKVLAQRAELEPAERLILSLALFFGKPVPPRVYRDNSP